MSIKFVAVENLTFTYSDSEKPALLDINLQINQGEFIVIAGPSGCGKSTLALCLAGFIPHGYSGDFKGQVLLNGLDTRHHPPARLAGVVGLVQQDPEGQLCTMNVADEVAFGPENLCLSPREVKERVYWALEAVGGGELLERHTYSLSGGEKQRVAIASVLAMNPDLLILDEPTANLDPSCTQEVLSVVRELQHKFNTTVIVIEHRLEQLLPMADRLIIMENGRIIEDGRPEAVRGKNAGITQVRTAGKPRIVSVSYKPLLSVDNLSVAYGNRRALADVNFKLYPGEIAAVMGANGSGKTTLFQSLVGIVKTDTGKVSLNGKDISAMKAAQRAAFFGLTFQNPNHQIFESTLYKEAALPSVFLRKGVVDWEKIDELLTEFELLPYRGKVPFALSLGEKKRLTLVSVLGYEPQVLVLDEPLAGQDSKRVELLLSAVNRHAGQGGAAIIACHDPMVVAASCQRVLFLEQGRLVIDAPTSEAFAKMAAIGYSEYLPVGYQAEAVFFGGAGSGQ